MAFLIPKLPHPPMTNPAKALPRLSSILPQSKLAQAIHNLQHKIKQTSRRLIRPVKIAYRHQKLIQRPLPHPSNPKPKPHQFQRKLLHIPLHRLLVQQTINNLSPHKQLLPKLYPQSNPNHLPSKILPLNKLQTAVQAPTPPPLLPPLPPQTTTTVVLTIRPQLKICSTATISPTLSISTSKKQETFSLNQITTKTAQTPPNPKIKPTLTTATLPIKHQIKIKQ